jgi:hypothetical protein
MLRNPPPYCRTFRSSRDSEAGFLPGHVTRSYTVSCPMPNVREGVNRVTLTAGRRLPFYPNKQTNSVSVGRSQSANSRRALRRRHPPLGQKHRLRARVRPLSVWSYGRTIVLAPVEGVRSEVGRWTAIRAKVVAPPRPGGGARILFAGPRLLRTARYVRARRYEPGVLTTNFPS